MYGLLSFDKFTHNHHTVKIQNISITTEISYIPLRRCSLILPLVPGNQEYFPELEDPSLHTKKAKCNWPRKQLVVIVAGGWKTLGKQSPVKNWNDEFECMEKYSDKANSREAELSGKS